MELTLTPKQTEFYEALFDDNGRIATNDYTEFYYFGGFGSGKSRIVCTSIHQICMLYPNAHGVFIRNTVPELRDSVIPQYNSYFNHQGYTFKTSERVAEYYNGTRLDFRSFDEPAKILSNEYDFMAYSQLEEMPEELFLQGLGRNRRKVGGLGKNIVLAEGNPSNNWVKNRLKDRPLTDKMFLVEARTYDNPYLPPDYIETLQANYPPNWIKRFVLGEWEAWDEAVFPEFSDHDHPEGNVMGLFTPPKTYESAIGGDYGYRNPSCWLWGCVDYDGNIIIYDEFYEKEQLIEDLVKANRRHGHLNTVLDYSTKRPDRDGKSVWTEFERLGLPLIESNKDEMKNINTLNIKFKKKTLTITRNCVNLIRELKQYKWKRLKLGEEKNQPEEPVDKDNHAIDALCYLVNYIDDVRSVDPAKIRELQSLRVQTIEIPEPSWEDKG